MKAKTALLWLTTLGLGEIVWLWGIYQSAVYRSGEIAFWQLALAGLLILAGIGLVLLLTRWGFQGDYTVLAIVLTLYHCGLLLQFRLQSVPEELSATEKAILTENIKSHFVFTEEQKTPPIARRFLFPTPPVGKSLISFLGLSAIMLGFWQFRRHPELVQFLPAKLRPWRLALFIVLVLFWVILLFYKNNMSTKFISVAAQLAKVPLAILGAKLLSHFKLQAEAQDEGHGFKEFFRRPPEMPVLLLFLAITALPALGFGWFQDAGFLMLYAVLVISLLFASGTQSRLVLLAPVLIMLWLTTVLAVPFNRMNRISQEWESLGNIDMAATNAPADAETAKRAGHLFSADHSGMIGYGPETIIFPHQNSKDERHTFTNVINLGGKISAILILMLYSFLLIQSLAESRALRQTVGVSKSLALLGSGVMLGGEALVHILSATLLIPASLATLPFIDHSPVSFLASSFLAAYLMFPAVEFSGK